MVSSASCTPKHRRGQLLGGLLEEGEGQLQHQSLVGQLAGVRDWECTVGAFLVGTGQHYHCMDKAGGNG